MLLEFVAMQEPSPIDHREDRSQHDLRSLLALKVVLDDVECALGESGGNDRDDNKDGRAQELIPRIGEGRRANDDEPPVILGQIRRDLCKTPALSELMKIAIQMSQRRIGR